MDDVSGWTGEPPEGPDEEARGLPGFLVALLFFALSAVWIVGFSLVTVGALTAWAAATGELDASSVTRLLQEPLVLGVTSAVQTGGLLALAAAMVLALKRRWKDAFAVRGARVGAFAGAVGVGLAAGLFAGWISQVLLEWVPALHSDAFELIGRAMLEGPLPGRMVFFFTIVIVAPVVEELLFRGFVWDALEESWGGLAAWGVTTVAFACYHLVPIHVISVLSTGALLGWLRLTSGSLWPPMLAHFLNNALALGSVLVLGEAEWEVGILQAAVSLVICLVAAAIAWRWGRPRAPQPGLIGSPAPGAALH